ncbi:hypothetical protein EVAR_54416_1 [Eumeta japonica]|uniref:Uncharacterized protein n=1 Tax=Eumeta variegata TaxID=151549 RepID=A0A4C1Y825_EUMVA|nr:hypothetical protein EVAR_54416_1 [Eumeta japonica]
MRGNKSLARDGTTRPRDSPRDQPTEKLQTSSSMHASARAEGKCINCLTIDTYVTDHLVRYVIPAVAFSARLSLESVSSPSIIGSTSDGACPLPLQVADSMSYVS